MCIMFVGMHVRFQKQAGESYTHTGVRSVCVIML